ncbi:MAG: tetratricopeptide repeat protein [Nitrospirota bacterium]|nr:tetratricopeptide repeat protein [Nitrospirota bacterium]
MRLPHSIAPFAPAPGLVPACPRAPHLLSMALAVLLMAGCASAPKRDADAAAQGTPGAAFAAAIGALNDGHTDAARDAFRHLAENPATPPAVAAQAWVNLGVALSRGGDFEAARVALTEALSRAPEMADAHFNLALAERSLGHYPSARDHYFEAARLAPARLDIPYNLGILYELYLNQPQQAMSAYSRYLDGGGPQAEQVRQWMETLAGQTAEQKGSDR